MSENLPESNSYKALSNDFASLFAKIGDDPARKDLARTPERLFALWEKLLSGYSANLKSELGGIIPFNPDCKPDSFNVIRLEKIPFYSICEHHLMPFFGEVSIVYIPSSGIAGIAGIARVVKLFSHRLQIQERLTNEIASFLYDSLDPKFLKVEIEAMHFCLVMQDFAPNSRLKTSKILGDTNLKRHI